jgi:DNA-binding beta-propeller fold protein YncE
MIDTDSDAIAAETQGAARPLAFVKHLRGEGFTVIDAERHRLLGRVGEGRQPHALEARPGGRWAYVPYMASNALEVVDLRTLTVADRVESVGTAPVGAVLTRTGSHLFVSTYGGLPGSDRPGVAVLRTDDDRVEPVERLPVGKAAGLAVDVRNDVWIALKEADELVRVSGTPPFEERDRFAVAGGPQDLAYEPAYGLLGVNNADAGSVTFVDTLEATVLGSVPAPNPRGGTAVPAWDRWFVGDTDGDGVSAVDVDAVRRGETGPEALESVSLGTPTAFTDATADGELVVVDAYDDDRVAFLDPGTLEVVARVAIGSTPRHPRFSADGGTCYVPSVDDDAVTVVDVDAIRDDRDPVVTEIDLPDGAGPAGCFRTDRGGYL